MVFDNGDSYVGQFQGGFTRGLGTFYTEGYQHYKYHDVSITQEQLKDSSQVQSFEETVEIKNIFGPILSHYLNIKPSYFEIKGEKDFKT